MFRLATRLLSFLLLLLGLPAALFAQATGTITGTVTDANGAVVRGAKVILTNMASKDTRRSASNGEGFFSFSGLPSGDFAVRVEASGFKTWEQEGIHILPGDRKNVSDIALAVGAATEVVTVEASASEVQVVDSGDKASVLTSKNISNLALQGRDVTELIRVLPGFVNTTGGLSNSTYDNTRVGILGGSQIQNFAANGGGLVPNAGSVGSGATDIISDGARVIDPGCNCSATQTINADMVSEVKVTTSSFSAESSRSPVTIQAIGKSGGSDYHGSAYFHFRDSALNSNDYRYNQYKIDQPDTRYMYPGVNFGGPVKIPGTNFNKTKKLVFWAGYENYRQRTLDVFSNGGLLLANIPTLSERAGLLDPTLPDNKLNCDALKGNPGTAYIVSQGSRCAPVTSVMINGVSRAVTNSDISTLIQPGAKAYLNSPMFKRMVPNYTPTAMYPYNFVSPVMSRDDGQMFHPRVDYSLSEKNKLYVSYNYQRDNQDLTVGQQYYAMGNAYKYDAGTMYKNRSHTLAGDLVTIFNSTLTNELQANFSYMMMPIVYKTGDAVTSSALGYPYKVGFGSPYIPALVNP